MASLFEEGDTMNLHNEPIGSVFWTQDGMYRARLEVKMTHLCECLLFGHDGEPLVTIRYLPNGEPYHRRSPNSHLTLIKPTTH